ncbi:redox-sensing transcriptional repressor [Eubacterium maltosivorans]|uniref:redox-sensing transcriptional repressor Rex n=1 Tax=Eubacterium maltosivorans TaxID=2041044 RepID=UPI00088F93AD|nr:redox-sensing transcriptional repressor Rex [Eubacterium maltosivorans]WPK81324.1 Redox-sensing transcriptional repressor Rex 1 [Eubacterium maltosivorans]SDO60896.1 redox-sensing transcriptional repressor [Eubacterium maltosivorans]
MQTFSKRVSMTVVKRLPKYYQYLTDLQDQHIEKISSKELAAMMGLTASQIRQDLNSFGAYGQQGYGYKVKELKEAIRKILGLDLQYNCIIIGSGNLGHAIVNYERFKEEGIHFKAMFDVDPDQIGKKVGDVTVYHMDDLDAFVAHHKIDICILSVPQKVGQETTDRVVELGIKAILNFVPLDLTVPDDVVVESVNITDSLFTLTYLINEEEESE